MKNLSVTLPKPAPFVYFMTWSLLLSTFANVAYFTAGFLADSKKFDPWVISFVLLLIIAQLSCFSINGYIHIKVEYYRDSLLLDGGRPLPSMKGTLSRLLKIRSWFSGFLAFAMIFGLVLMCAEFARPFGELSHWYQTLNVINFLPVVFTPMANERILKAIRGIR